MGINRTNEEAANFLMTSGRNLAWLQDTVEETVWTRWNVTWRDVRILDSRNRLTNVYNLTEHDLSILTNREALKQMFLNAATIVSKDSDRLPDDWERQFLGSTSEGPRGDSDGDGVDNLTEFAFGTDPADPRSVPFVTSRFSPFSGIFSLTYRRRAGSVADYFVETSSDLRQWLPAPPELGTAQMKILYDGTGRAEVNYSFARTTNDPPSRFIRVRAEVKKANGS